MKQLINKGRRRLGVPGRPAIILDPNQSVVIDDRQADEIQKNRTCARWLQVGVLVLTESDGVVIQPEKVVRQPIVRKRQRVVAKRDEREEVVLPESVTGEGVEIHHLGGGWYEVWVNGFKVTDKNIRKDTAQAIAGEYEK